MNLTKRIISSALVLSMATLTIPVEAYATSNTIKGQVFFEDGSPAAGVKINILSSNIDEVYDDEVVGFQITTIRLYILILMAHTNLTAHQIIALLRWI